MNLRLEANMVIVATLISLAHMWFDSPYLMGAFVFIAQPLFLIAGLYYLRHVFRDLRRHDAL